MPPLQPGLRVRITVPASTANLGPGFDAVGLALGMLDGYDVEVLPEPGHLEVALEGEGARRLPRDGSHLVARRLRDALGACGIGWLEGYGLRLTCRNTIPMSAGLGSSATAIVAGLGLGFALARGGDLTEADLGLVNTHAGIAEGHPDNSSASVFGGLTVSWMPSLLVVRTARPVLHPDVVPVVLVPVDQRLDTATARAVLGPQVARAEAVQQAGRAALLVHALTAEPALLLDATQDWLHQEQRRPAYPVTMGAVDTLRGLGHAAVVSGAGPTVLCLTTTELAGAVVGEARTWGRGWRVLTPGVPDVGLQVLGSGGARG
ncbi:homoserine kinase [Ornithinimicrobium avium]|uniref:Homoserine kinase n=1 Tax=Ornithinimicrobium avium TaxID=2283195 RepID=A0A345NLZ1_9MICO|nr:homoserine kinase [Ornithinimicrobium avium]AXH96049.1 homoserine kinase [Ornithinimicrobium avium]